MHKALIVFFILFSAGVKAQYDPILSLYWNNKLWHNPAYAGAEDKKVISFSARNQWSSLNGNPVTGIISYDESIEKINSGIGAILLYDKIGGITLKQAGFIYSYNLKLSSKAGLRFGTQLSLAHQTIENTWIFIGPNDPSIPTSSSSSFNTDIDLGMFFTLDKFYAGISTKHLLEPTFGGLFNQVRSYYGMAGYTITLSPNFSTMPSFIIRNSGSSTAVDINNTFSYFDKYFIGTSYRPGSTNSLVINSGIKMSFFELSLSYDLPGKIGGETIEANIKARF